MALTLQRLRALLALLVLLTFSTALMACQSSSDSDARWLHEHEDRGYPSRDDLLMPDDHRVDWIARHGVVAISEGDDCASCHMEQDCITCHTESIGDPYAVHPPNFALIHATEPAQDIADCTTCHRLDTFCAACHTETRFSPQLDDSPPSTVSFHPPGWLDGSTPNNHGVMARRDIHDCASCHIEQDCITCHVGINPHPPEFRFECRHWLETNPTPCAECHGDTGRLQDLCF